MGWGDKPCRKCGGFGHQGKRAGCKYCGSAFVDVEVMSKETKQEKQVPVSIMGTAQGKCWDRVEKLNFEGFVWVAASTTMMICGEEYGKVLEAKDIEIAVLRERIRELEAE